MNGGGDGSGYGGAIFNLDGIVNLINATLAGDSVTAGTVGSGGTANGGELYNLAYGKTSTGSAGNATATILNSILANSVGAATGDLVNNTDPSHASGRALVTANYSLIRNGGAANITSGAHNIFNQNPNLSILANYGGPTQTMGLRLGSPAIDAGFDTTQAPYNLTTDQRGPGFPRKVGPQVDIGAFESSPVNPMFITITTTSPSIGVISPAVTLTVTPAPMVMHMFVLYGNGMSYDLLNSTRLDVPWQITGIQAVFSTPVTGDIDSLTGFSNVNLFAGSGTNTLTWTFSTPLADADLTAQLLGTGADAITGSGGVALAGSSNGASGTNFSQTVKVLYGDVNGDGVVNALDMAEIQARILGQSVSIADMFLDVNGFGVIDSSDLTSVSNRSGHTLI